MVIEENIWFADVEPYQLIQRTECGHVKSEVILASDMEDAYAKANAMIDQYSDANYDGPGDITNFFCREILGIEKITP
jgi:hypothetical protein